MVDNSKFCAIDAEGDVGKLGLLGVAFWSDICQEYVTDHDTIKELLYTHASNDYTFIAHNAEYDLSVIFWPLDIPMKAVYFNGRFNRGEWKWHKRKRMCQLWDTMALSGGISLARLGQSLGLPKYPTPSSLTGKDINKYEWKCDKHDIWECVRCYSTRDVEICYRFMSDLCANLDVWGVKPHRRISGLASKVWRALDKPSPIGISDKRIVDLARNSYHGGRVETIKLGHLNQCFTGDVTSMYPSIMLETSYPDPEHMQYVIKPLSYDYIYQYEGVAECDVTVPNMYLPPLPLRYKGEIQYPIGKLHGVWTFLELRYAMQLGCTIDKVHAAGFSPVSLAPFTNFIGILWEMREQYKSTGDSRELFAKLFMNNLYGYLGMKGAMERTDIYMAEPNIHISKQPKSTWFTDEGRLFLTFIREQKARNDWTNVLWASQTTAGSRIKLHRYMAMQGSNVLYCDTDSVFSMAPLLGVSEGLGALRDDGRYQQIIISAPKLYGVKQYPEDMPESWRYEPCNSHHTKECDECLWYAKAKGVKRDLALEFLRTGVATFSAPIKPRSQGRRKIQAGTWVDITRSFQYTPARRHPLDPDALIGNYSWSDTSPLFVGPS